MTVFSACLIHSSLNIWPHCTSIRLTASSLISVKIVGIIFYPSSVIKHRVNYRLIFTNTREKYVSTHNLGFKLRVAGMLFFLSLHYDLNDINKDLNLGTWASILLLCQHLLFRRDYCIFLAERNTTYVMGCGLAKLMISGLLSDRGFKLVALWKKPQ